MWEASLVPVLKASSRVSQCCSRSAVALRCNSKASSEDVDVGTTTTSFVSTARGTWRKLASPSLHLEIKGVAVEPQETEASSFLQACSGSRFTSARRRKAEKQRCSKTAVRPLFRPHPCWVASSKPWAVASSTAPSKCKWGREDHQAVTRLLP